MIFLCDCRDIKAARGIAMSTYPKKRELDGVYFRIHRNGKWCDICFSDMTEEERKKVMENRSIEWLKELANILANAIRGIGDQLDLIADFPDEEHEESD